LRGKYAQLRFHTLPDGSVLQIWALGQFIDHDLVASIEQPDGKKYPIELSSGDNTATMTLSRLFSEQDGDCNVPITTNTPLLDAGVIYSANDDFLHSTLREPDSCKLRTSDGGFLPITTFPEGPNGGEYSGKRGKFFFIAGDVRVNEHAVLTAMHTIWVREHNRICDAIEKKKDKAGIRKLDVNGKFELARKVRFRTLAISVLILSRQ
jgi:peroxidase